MALKNKKGFVMSEDGFQDGHTKTARLWDGRWASVKVRILHRSRNLGDQDSARLRSQGERVLAEERALDLRKRDEIRTGGSGDGCFEFFLDVGILFF